MGAKPTPHGNAIDATLKVVIIYDTFDLAVKAKVMLERGRADEPAHWNVKPWRVDVLELPPAADVALTKAAEAHLIMLAVRQVQPLLVDWLERWAVCRHVQEAALAVWFGGNAETHSARATPELLQFADRHRLSLIIDDSTVVEDKSSRFASDLHERETCLTPTLQNCLEPSERDYYRHWGIND